MITEAAKLRERIRRPDFGHLEIEVTVDDPKAYTKAWTVALRQQFVADTELIDEICAEARSSRSRLNEGTAQAQHGNVHTQELVKPPSLQLDQVFDNAPGIRVAFLRGVCESGWPRLPAHEGRRA